MGTKKYWRKKLKVLHCKFSPQVNLLVECFAKGESFVFLIKSPESIAPHGKSSITQKQFSMSKAQNGCSVSCHLLKLRARHLL